MTLLTRAGLVSVGVHFVVVALLVRVAEPRALPRTPPVEVELVFHPPVARRAPVTPPPVRSPAPTAPPTARSGSPRRSLPVPISRAAERAELSVAPEGPLGPPSSGGSDAGVSAAGDEGGDSVAPPVVTVPPTEAVLVSLPRIEYPPAALLNELEGVVRLQVVLGADGVVREVSVVDAPSAELAEAARAALRAARFRPATRDGQPVESRFSYRYRFELR